MEREEYGKVSRRERIGSSVSDESSNDFWSFAFLPAVRKFLVDGWIYSKREHVVHNCIRTANGDGGLGHVRGQNELSHPWRGRFEGFQLLMRGQSGIQGKHLQRRITLAVQLFSYLPSAHRGRLYLLLPG